MGGLSHIGFQRETPAQGLEIVAVTWTDAHSSDDDPVDTSQPIGLRCTTVGFVIRHSRKGILLGFDRHEDEYRISMAIPAAMIVKVKCLG